MTSPITDEKLQEMLALAEKDGHSDSFAAAVIRELQATRAEWDALKNRIDRSLNHHLSEMKPDYDDSIVGFNEAWDIVRKVFDDAKARAALPPEAAKQGEDEQTARKSENGT